MPSRTDPQSQSASPQADEAPTARVPRIGIVGGGPSGLFTAYELQRLADGPIAMTLFEASGRLGGKILSPRFTNSPRRYEAGAAEFYDYEHFGHDPLKALIRELGLPIRPLAGSTVVMGQGRIANRDDLRARLGDEAESALLAFDAIARDRMSPRGFYHSGDAPDPDLAGPPHPRFATLLDSIPSRSARDYLERMIHSDLAAEPAQTSVEYGLQNYLMNDPAYLRLYRIEGGNERLVDALAERIDAKVLLGHRVTGVGRSADGSLQVTAEGDAGLLEREFDHLVVALPHAAILGIEYRDLRLDAAIRRHHVHHDHPGHYLRITARFESPRPATGDEDGFWMLDAFGGCCLYDELAGAPEPPEGAIFGWLLGGDAARHAAGQDDAGLIESALASLPAWLRPAGVPAETRVHRWIGSVSAMPGGERWWSLEARHRPEPVAHASLLLVGDYLFDSTLNGALDSAEYAAASIAADLARTREENRR